MKRAHPFIISISIAICQIAFAQETENPYNPAPEPIVEPVKKFEPIVAFGFSLGAQGISIPPAMTKVSLGARYLFHDWTLYALPGISVGLVGSGLHLETGVSWKIITLDYSLNRLDYIADEGIKPINHNINIGCAFLLNPERKRNLWLWIKAGKTFHEVGYTQDDPPQMDGWNIEAKALMRITIKKQRLRWFWPW